MGSKEQTSPSIKCITAKCPDTLLYLKFTATGKTTNPIQRIAITKFSIMIHRVNTKKEPIADPKLPTRKKKHTQG